MFIPVFFHTYLRPIITITILLLLSMSVTADSGPKISIGTVIDTKGMVHDSTTIASSNFDQNGNAAIMYHDSQMSNGGNLQLNKEILSSGAEFSAKKPLNPGSIYTQKVLGYNESGTGSHIASDESLIVDTMKNSGLGGGTGISCALTSHGGTSTDTGSKRSISTASIDFSSSSTLQIGSRSQISADGLSYIVSANTTPSQGQDTATSTISSSFTSYTVKTGEETKFADKTRVSVFDLFTRKYQAGSGLSLNGETKSSGMVSSKTTSEHIYDQSSQTGVRKNITGSEVYVDDLLTNGGNVSEVRTLSVGENTESSRIITYDADGSHTMQTEERVVAVKESSSVPYNASAPTCVFAEPGNTQSNNSASQTITASSILFGVDSAQIVSTAHVDMKDDSHTDKPINLNYKVDITSPLLFDAAIIQSMKDPDKDNLYEDLNGNGTRIYRIWCSSLKTLKVSQKAGTHPVLIIIKMERWISQI